MRFTAFSRLVRALRGLPIRQLCLLCLLPLLLSACFMPQSWVDSSPPRIRPCATWPMIPGPS